MPNRTIYIADADVPVFEKAQELAGGNLSATIARALHRFVETEEARVSGFEEVTVRVGTIAKTDKRFLGRFLAKGRVHTQNGTRKIAYDVYQTQKERFAVYSRNVPGWGNPRSWSSYKPKGYDWSAYNVDIDVDVEIDSGKKYKRKQQDWSQYDWSQWSNSETEYRLEVYDTLDQLRDNIPAELYEAVLQALHGDEGIEFLDI
ncbi:MAG: EXLDI protein [Chloroflexota bacterium]|nr:EXLDI protein [Chloroflexota bacterium]